MVHREKDWGTQISDPKVAPPRLRALILALPVRAGACHHLVMMFPPSFMAEVERQRVDQIAELERRLAELRGRAIEPTNYDDALAFEPGDPNFERAARVAVEILDSCHSIAQVAAVRLRPYDSKYPGAWRIEASYTGEGGWGAGAEAYLPREQLIAIWGS